MQAASRNHPDVPFALPDRPQVTQVRQIDKTALLSLESARTMPMRGFEGKFVDIVDYIVRITEEIWTDRAIGRIYDTYDSRCTVYSPYGVSRSVEEVVTNTLSTMAAFPEDEARHLNVAWSGNDRQGFYTSHLGWLRATNNGPSSWGPATGQQISYHFVADCISLNNRIHTEWLVHDTGALVRDLGLTIDEAAQIVAAQTPPETLVLVPATPIARTVTTGERATPELWMRGFFQDIWTARQFGRLSTFYAPDAVTHWAGGRVATGHQELEALIVSTMDAFSEAVMEVQHVCWSEERDDIVVAVRWQLSGNTRRGGILGDLLPESRFIAVPGASHFRFEQGSIVEEWTVFDEVAAIAQALIAG